MASARRLEFLAKRPLLSMGLLGSTGVASVAAAVELSAPDETLPRQYERDVLDRYWKRRPLSTTKRFCAIFYEIAPLAGAYVRDFYLLPPPDEASSLSDLEGLHASYLREALTNLGPAFVKAGQQLSIRPDLVSPQVLKELQKLCDAVRPVPDDVALDAIRRDLNVDDLSTIFANLHLVASASLGQVYKAHLVDSGDAVAIKVQRPDMQRSFSLDLFLLQSIGVLVDCFTTTFTNQPPFHRALYESFARGSYMELDYENEAENQRRFQQELAKRQSPVLVPSVYPEYSTQRVLTSEWIQGKKLADCPKDQIRSLIPVGVELFLTQLLDIGAFHADPHPGKRLCR